MAGNHDDDEGMPRWVKLTAILGGALALLAVAVMVLAGGNHGPGRHADTATSLSDTTGTAGR
jgi:hypothetical protein